MFRKYIKFFKITTISMAAFFILPNFSFANIQITEIMYDVEGTDTGREWIEIFNSGNEVLDVTKFKLFEADTNHGLVAVDGNNILNSSEYAVIADNPTKFRIDFPNYSSKIFDSTFSLSNDGESLSLKNESNTIVDSVSYDVSLGAKGDGKSLQKVSNIWQVAISSPGAENIVSSNNDTCTSTSTSTDESIASSTSNASTSTATTTSSNNNSNSDVQTIVRTVTRYISVHSNPEDLSNYEENSTFEVSAGRERITHVGTPINFLAKYKISKNSNEVSIFSWSFGDGTREIGERVSHIYKFPGDYTVILNGVNGGKNAVSRTNIKVLVPEINTKFSSSGDLEIYNLGKNEINLGNWKIRSSSGDYVFPDDTIIGAERKIILSREYSKISFDEKVGISLFDPSGNLISKPSYSEIKNIATSSPDYLSKPISTSSNISNNLLDIQEKDVLRFIEEYKRFSIKNKKKEAVFIDKNIVSIDSNIEIPNTDVVSATSSPTNGFFSKIIVSPIKAVARIFYDI